MIQFVSSGFAPLRMEIYCLRNLEIWKFVFEKFYVVKIPAITTQLIK
jgi:hypothetical protein